MILKGRRKITTEYSSSDIQNIDTLVKVINSGRDIHLQNKLEIEYLIDYKNGIQTILNKEKSVRPEINNKLVVNHAQMITRNVIGYFLGTPIQYIQSGADKKEEIDRLNKYVAYEDKSSVDKEIGEYQSICGTAFRIIYTDGILADEVPFEDKCLNPATTYVIYENSIAEKPVVAVTYYNILGEDNAVIGTKLYAYTEFGLFTFSSNVSNGYIGEDYNVDYSPYSIGGIPIIEYPNNMWRIGDWELCIGLMDAINALQSGRLDDIDQVVQSLLVFINADVDTETYDQMRESGVVCLKNTTNYTSEVKTMSTELDQAGINLMSSELESLLYAIIGIPDRNSRSGGGGDTGQAVELRDGWADLEIVARNKEIVFKKVEKQSLRIILNIINNKEGSDLSLLDVDIKFSRNKNNNLLVKTQGYMNLLGTKTLAPADCLTIVDLVSDVNEYISRGEEFWGDLFAGKSESLNKQNSFALQETANKDESNLPIKKDGE